jgi:hypothetical protein
MVKFTSEKDRDFCKGLWLEKFVHSKLKDVADEAGLQDFSASIEIESSSGVRNEIDAAFLYNNELYVIECKTAKMDEKGSDVLYKLDAISGYAGLYTKSIVITYKEMNKFDRKRARDLRINLIEGRDINRLPKKIIQIIHPNERKVK